MTSAATTFSPLSTDWRKVDDRRNRDYHCDIGMTLRFTPPEGGTDICGSYFNDDEQKRWPSFSSMLRAAVLDLLAVKVAKIEWDVAVLERTTANGIKSIKLAIGYSSFHKEWYVSLNSSISVDKPSLIPDESRAADIVADDLFDCVDADILDSRLASTIEACIENFQRKRDEAQRIEALTSELNHIGAWLGKQAASRARKIVRWQQRLAALRAEMAVEQSVQMGALLADEEILESIEGQGLRVRELLPLLRKWKADFLAANSDAGVFYRDEVEKKRMLDVALEFDAMEKAEESD